MSTEHKSGFIICDDPLDESRMATPEQRDRARIWWDETLAELRRCRGAKISIIPGQYWEGPIGNYK